MPQVTGIGMEELEGNVIRDGRGKGEGRNEKGKKKFYIK